MVAIMGRSRKDKSFVNMVIILFLAMFVYFPGWFVCDKADGASLSNRHEMQAAVYKWLRATAANNFMDSLRVQEGINRAMNFVEFHAKTNKICDTIHLNPDTYFYPIPSAAATDGVLRVLRANSVKGQLEALTQRDLTDFGKAEFNPQTIYSVVGDSLMIYKTADVTDILYVFSWKQTDDLALPATTIDIPFAYRRMILDLAIAECERMRGNMQVWNETRSAIMQEIFGLPAEPDKEPQELGLESTP